MVIWLVGMYASGKTAIAEEMREILERDNIKVLVLNGGDIRKILGNELAYSLEDRKQNAERIARICKYLSDQGMTVICAMLSLFEDTRRWNRENVERYYEVFVDVSMANLLSRDHSNLYRKALEGQAKDVVGVDIEFVKPQNPDMVVNNDRPRTNLTELAQIIIDDLKRKFF